MNQVNKRKPVPKEKQRKKVEKSSSSSFDINNPSDVSESSN